MIGFGVLGYFARKTGFSPPALLLGLILGPIAESGFRDMLVLSGGDPVPYMLSRPASVVILLMVLAALYHALRRKAPPASADCDR